MHSDLLCVDGWALCADFYLDGEHIQQMPHFIHGDHPVLFVETRRIDALTPDLSKLTVPYVLITADHWDTLSGCATGSPGAPHALLASSALAAWWGIFPGVVHEKFRPLPLGPKWEEQHYELFTEDTSARYALLSSNLLHEARQERRRLVHAKFHTGTTDNPLVQEHQGDRVRAAAAVAALDAGSEDIDGFVPSHDYLRGMGASHFAVCPPGSAPDTHRLWEALYLRTVPIVRRYPPLSPILDSLPVLQLDDWADMTQEYLHAQIAPLREKMERWDGKELSRSYWLRSIRHHGSRSED